MRPNLHLIDEKVEPWTQTTSYGGKCGLWEKIDSWGPHLHLLEKIEPRGPNLYPMEEDVGLCGSNIYHGEDAAVDPPASHREGGATGAQPAAHGGEDRAAETQPELVNDP